MSMDLTGENIAQLKKLFPEAVTEGKIDFEVLKALLGGEIEQRQEYYKFTWNGKEAARAYARTQSMGTLRPCVEESSGKDGAPGRFDSENLYIEGDNLEVLKLLQGAYHKKIKMIYIDPPYNTGKDFVYPDNYRDSIKNYKELTGQTDAKGKSTRANPETSGRYHTDWLNMMYPRLILARNLLTDDGVIFISIDEIEYAKLRYICDDIFGEDNHIADFVWHNKRGGGNDSKYVAVEHEYVVLYAKSKDSLGELFIPYNPSYLSRYKEEDSVGKFYWDTFKRKSGKQYYQIICPDGTILDKDELGNPISWLRSENRFYQDKKNGEVRFIKSDNSWSVQFKQRLPEGKKPRTIFLEESILEDQGTTSDGSHAILTYFGKNVFDNPKPIKLIKHLLSFSLKDHDIVLDFFSGSGTTADAIFRMNINNSHCKYILVQLPESLDRGLMIAEASKKIIIENAISFLEQIKRPHFLTELGKERIRRAAKKIREENPLACQNQDMGFKVFKLDTSNLLPWNPNAETLAQDLYNAVDNVLADRSTDDLLYEILLKCNLPLTLPIEKKQLGANTVYIVGMGALAICLDKTIPATIAEEIVKLRDAYAPIVPMQVVFLDTGFDDVGKANALQILKQAGFEEKSIQTI